MHASCRFYGLLIVGLVGGLLAGAMLPQASAARDSTFVALGDVDGAAARSVLYGLSADGRTAVGRYSRVLPSKETEKGSYWWRVDDPNGAGSIEEWPDAVYHSARDVSGDGSVVVGMAEFGDGGRGFRWTESDGLTDLGDFPGGAGRVHPRGVSSDGRAVVGWAQLTSGKAAFRWTVESGFQDLGTLPGGASAAAVSTSSDGSVVVGQATSSEGYVAFRWTEADGMISLGDLAGGETRSKALVVSDDGKTVGGWGTTADGEEAFLWSEETGMVGLGHLTQGGFDSTVSDLSSDGSVAVGYSYTAWGPWPFIWDARNGMRQLQAVLMQDYHLPIGDWELWYARAVSSNGRTIAGYGVNPDGVLAAWIAEIAPGCSDGLDNDADGLVDYPADPGCRNEDWHEDPACDDRRDNDSDGAVDFAGSGQIPPDGSCRAAWQDDESDPRACGIGFELALVLLGLRSRFRRRARRGSF